ncbi:MAG: hypothetical protein LCH61_05935 [Proteobacteria bacterium]|nr:hypothetical protein [Pseudomonadota bacterium]
MANNVVRATGGNVLRTFGYIVGAIFLITFVAPAILMQTFVAGVGMLIWNGPNSVETGRGPVSVSQGGIVSKAMPESRAAAAVKLADLSAERYEAGGTLRRLRFVGVQFTGGDDRMTNPADRKRQDLVLDLNLPKDLGVVFIAAEPINWSVNNRGSRERARIGFEGAAPFGIRTEQGAVSGFRIGAFGASRSAYPVDLVDETRANISRFCTAMQHWGNHFGVEFDRMEYVLLTNPTSVSVDADRANSVGGRVGAFYSGSTLRTFCFGPDRGSSGSRDRKIYNRVSRQWN